MTIPRNDTWTVLVAISLLLVPAAQADIPIEDRFGTEPAPCLALGVLEDADQDGLSDADEGLTGSDPRNPDSDGDGLSDCEELRITRSDPLLVDTDNDGVDDGTEAVNNMNPLHGDTDGDGLSDHFELVGGPNTDPRKSDSDGDGFDDGYELALGFDPINPADNPVFQAPAATPTIAVPTPAPIPQPIP